LCLPGRIPDSAAAGTFEQVRLFDSIVLQKVVVRPQFHVHCREESQSLKFQVAGERTPQAQQFSRRHFPRHCSALFRHICRRLHSGPSVVSGKIAAATLNAAIHRLERTGGVFG